MTDRRRHVQVLDCTIRDGGLCNRWQFDHAFVAQTFDALHAAGVDIMEIGYQHSLSRRVAEDGPWRFCTEEDVRRVASESRMKLSCMLDVGAIEAHELRPADDSVIDILRVATYASDIEEAIRLCDAATDLGYEVFCNVMAITTCTPHEVDLVLERIRQSSVCHASVVDSFGAMYPHQIRYLIRKYKNWLRPDQQVGVHLHNNQQTAFANAIAAIDEGADVVDATIYGMGRGAGNVPLELLLMYLDDERHDVRPILGLLDGFQQMKDELKWGYQVPYGITGWLNEHPRTAIARMRADTPECLAFYEELTEHLSRPPHHRAQAEPS